MPTLNRSVDSTIGFDCDDSACFKLQQKSTFHVKANVRGSFASEIHLSRDTTPDSFANVYITFDSPESGAESVLREFESAQDCVGRRLTIRVRIDEGAVLILSCGDDDGLKISVT